MSLGGPLGTVDRDSPMCKFYTNIKSLHVITFLQDFDESWARMVVDVLDDESHKREQWPLAMPPLGECAVHLRTLAMAAAPREGATTMAVRERVSWQI